MCLRNSESLPIVLLGCEPYPFLGGYSMMEHWDPFHMFCNLIFTVFDSKYVFLHDHYKTWSFFLLINFAHHILWSNTSLLPNFSLKLTTPLFTASCMSHQGFSWLIHNFTLDKSIFLHIQYIVAQVHSLCNIWIFSYKKFFMKSAYSGTFRACNLVRKMLHFQC